MKTYFIFVACSVCLLLNSVRSSSQQLPGTLPEEAAPSSCDVSPAAAPAEAQPAPTPSTLLGPRRQPMQRVAQGVWRRPTAAAGRPQENGFAANSRSNYDEEWPGLSSTRCPTTHHTTNHRHYRGRGRGRPVAVGRPADNGSSVLDSIARAAAEQQARADLFTTGTERHPLYLEAAVEFLRLALLHEELECSEESLTIFGDILLREMPQDLLLTYPRFLDHSNYSSRSNSSSRSDYNSGSGSDYNSGGSSNYNSNYNNGSSSNYNSGSSTNHSSGYSSSNSSYSISGNNTRNRRSNSSRNSSSSNSNATPARPIPRTRLPAPIPTPGAGPDITRENGVPLYVTLNSNGTPVAGSRRAAAAAAAAAAPPPPFRPRATRHMVHRPLQQQQQRATAGEAGEAAATSLSPCL